jgi:N-carbamoylputrescine amidase
MQAGPTDPEAARHLRVAAIQVISRTGDVAGNLARAERLVAEASARGAELAVCPEFLTPGYAYERAMWRAAEPRGGITERWLSTLARRHGLYLGAGYLEVEAEDFFNTFALAAPDGSILGRVRKQSLPAYEGWVFRSSELPKTFDSPLGRIGVGICHDNHTGAFFARLRESQPDLLLMPHSAPCAPFGVELMRAAISEIGPYYARAFGIPTVLANKAQDRSVTRVPGLLPLRVSLEFPGLSSISDSNGEVGARASGAEAVILSSVALDPRRKRRPEPLRHFYWSRQPSRLATTLALVAIGYEAVAKTVYRLDRSRRPAAARALASASQADSASALEARSELRA